MGFLHDIVIMGDSITKICIPFALGVSNISESKNLAPEYHYIKMSSLFSLFFFFGFNSDFNKRMKQKKQTKEKLGYM